jgi:hypothetical protein
MRTFSDTAWDIASRYSDVLASETRDLAAAIDGIVPKWQPIETAPRDGEWISLWCKGQPLSLPAGVPAFWEDDLGWVAVRDDDLLLTDNPTHWMPLPAPPEKGKG